MNFEAPFLIGSELSKGGSFVFLLGSLFLSPTFHHISNLPSGLVSLVHEETSLAICVERDPFTVLVEVNGLVVLFLSVYRLRYSD